MVGKRDLLLVLVLVAAFSYQPPQPAVMREAPVLPTVGSAGFSEEARWLLGVVRQTYTP
jgi:hypothetical protein